MTKRKPPNVPASGGNRKKRIFPLYGVRLISLNDSFDSDTLHGDTGGINMVF